MVESDTPELSTAARSPATFVPRCARQNSHLRIHHSGDSFLVHIAIYGTWIFFWGASDSSHVVQLRIALAILSVSFVAASLLAHRYFNPLVRAVYTLASVWLGLVNFFFLAACASWIVYVVPLLFGVHLEKHAIAAVFFGLGLVAGIAAIVNAAWTRVVRITVKLPNLPAAWRGRTSAVVSDLHLGHVRNTGFLRRIVRKLSQIASGRSIHPGRHV